MGYFGIFSPGEGVICIAVQKKKTQLAARTCSSMTRRHYCHKANSCCQLLQDITPPRTKVGTPEYIISTVLCQAVKSLPSLFGILPSDEERRAGFDFLLKFGGVPFGSIIISCLDFSTLGPKRARQEPIDAHRGLDRSHHRVLTTQGIPTFQRS